MATTSNFKGFRQLLVGKTPLKIGGYFVPPNTSANLNKLRITNRFAGPGNVTFSAWIQDAAGNKCYLLDTQELRPGQGYTFAGDVLVDGDSIYVVCNTNDTALDVSLSVLEDTA